MVISDLQNSGCKAGIHPRWNAYPFREYVCAHTHTCSHLHLGAILSCQSNYQHVSPLWEKMKTFEEMKEFEEGAYNLSLSFCPVILCSCSPAFLFGVSCVFCPTIYMYMKRVTTTYFRTMNFKWFHFIFQFPPSEMCWKINTIQWLNNSVHFHRDLFCRIKIRAFIMYIRHCSLICVIGCMLG